MTPTSGSGGRLLRRGRSTVNRRVAESELVRWQTFQAGDEPRPRHGRTIDAL